MDIDVLKKIFDNSETKVIEVTSNGQLVKRFNKEVVSYWSIDNRTFVVKRVAGDREWVSYFDPNKIDFVQVTSNVDADSDSGTVFID